MDSLIAYIAMLTSKHKLSRENLATEILAKILRSDEDRILHTFLERCGITSSLDAVYSVHTQKGGAETRGIFDIQIHRDKEDSPLVIIESKFGANLTGHQRNTYLKGIDEGGLLLFIVPESRRINVSKELLGSYPLDTYPYNPFADKSGSVRTRVNGRLLGVTSWDDTLNTLQLSVRMHSSQLQDALLQDIGQLRRFCKVAEKEVFEPIPANLQNLGDSVSTLIHQLTWITRQLIDRCMEGKSVQTIPGSSRGKKKNETGADCEDFDGLFESVSLFYGRNLQLCEMQIWLGFWPLAWEGLPQSLLWIELYPKTSEENQIVKQLRGGEFRGIKNPFSDGWLIPIPITPGKTQNEVVDDAFQFVSRLKIFIETAQSGLATKG
jgi:hypothetical protein